MMELLNKKQEKLEKIEQKIKTLNRLKIKLNQEIELIKMQQDLEKYKAIEVMLGEKGISLDELINKEKKVI